MNKVEVNTYVFYPRKIPYNVQDTFTITTYNKFLFLMLKFLHQPLNTSFSSCHVLNYCIRQRYNILQLG